MSDESEASVLGSLPRSRPQRRSDKRGMREGQGPAKQPAAKQPAAKQPGAQQPAAKQPAAKQPAAQQPAAKERATKQSRQPSADRTQAQPAGQKQAPEQEPEPEPAARAACAASLADGAELIGTVVRASAELAEIALTLGARALRTALSRLPRP